MEGHVILQDLRLNVISSCDELSSRWSDTWSHAAAECSCKTSDISHRIGAVHRLAVDHWPGRQRIITRPLPVMIVGQRRFWYVTGKPALRPR